jgi:group I intron endonuclease
MFIYLLRNTINGKAYVGQTILSLEERWRGHLKSLNQGSTFYIHRAIRKYGVDAFEKGVIATAHTLEELDQLEVFHIKAQKTLAPNGYNLRPGGLRSPHSEASRKKMSETAKGRKMSQETRTKISLAQKGKIISEQACINISKALKGRTITESWRKKISESKKGQGLGRKRFFSPEHKLNLTRSKLGVKWSEERRQQSAANPPIGLPGEQNPQSKLTSEQIAKIRADKDVGVSSGILAKQYGISDGHVWAIWRRKVWAKAS